MIYDSITSCRGLYSTAVFFPHFSLPSLFFPSLTAFPEIIIQFYALRTRHHIRFTRIWVMVCSSIRIIFEMRAGVTVCYEDWSPALYSFLSKHHPWEQRFYLISQCCNLLEMKAILKYSTCCESRFTRTVLKVCVSFYYCRWYEGHGWNCAVTGAGNKLARPKKKNVPR